MWPQKFAELCKIDILLHADEHGRLLTQPPPKLASSAAQALVDV